MAFPKIERNVLITAIVVSIGHLFLIAFAAYKLGIAVPDCVPAQGKPIARAGYSKIAPNHYELHVIGKMWAWAPNKISIPAGTRIDFFITSQDVLHGFYIEGTNVNLTAVPGSITNASHTFHNPGVYRVICNEYCGIAHQNMYAEVEVTPAGNSEFVGISQISGAPAESGPVDAAAEPALSGRELATAKGCLACHSIDGSKLIGPTFRGLAGSEVELVDGSTATADAAYLQAGILQPDAHQRAGYPLGVMPKIPLTAAEVQALVAYIQSLQ